MSIPAEHRAYPDLDLSNDMSNTLVKKNVLSPHKQYEPSSNDIWPFGRTEATQIKVSLEVSHHHLHHWPVC